MDKFGLVSANLFNRKSGEYTICWVNPSCIVTLLQILNGDYAIELTNGQLGFMSKENFRELTGICEPIHIDRF